MFTVITFEDHGQDFLKWLIDNEGNIIDCWPFQASVWTNWQVVEPEILLSAGPGMLVPIIKDKVMINIKYPIESIEHFESENHIPAPFDFIEITLNKVFTNHKI